MKYDFTTQVSRENTGSSKWDGMYAANPNVPEGTVPFSVADMEFKNPPQIAEDIGEYLKNSIMGYTFATDAYYDAVIGWMKRRHNWDIKKEWIVEYPGVVPALYHMVNRCLTIICGVLLILITSRNLFHTFIQVIIKFRICKFKEHLFYSIFILTSLINIKNIL